jgi:hypothetical protein
MASGILIELLNASRTKDFNDISAKANAGDLSRIDFAVAYEKVEFDNVKKHHVIAEAAVKAGVWGNQADEYKGFTTFDLYLTAQIAAGHTKSYGKAWDDRYTKAWMAKNAKGNPDDPVEALTKSLEKATIEALQKTLK